MHKILLSFAVFFAVSTLYAQVPNPSFEDWKSYSYDNPTQWSVLGVTSIAAGYKSTKAVRIERESKFPQNPGAVLFGTAGAGGITGGTPFVGYPDSFVGYFKINMAAGDTGVILCSLRKRGKPISLDFYALTGNDSNTWTRIAFPLYYTDTGFSDSLVLAVTSTNPGKVILNSWIIADSFHFSGGYTADIPNGNFENFIQTKVDDPIGWKTFYNQVPRGYPVGITRSTDKVFGSYAVRMQNLAYANIYLPSYVLAGGQSGSIGVSPGFPVQGRDSIFYLNYKYTPKNQDTMSVGIFMFDKGVYVGAGFFASGDAQTTWKELAIPIYYAALYSGVPDSAAVFCAPFQGGKNATGESVLWVDGLKQNVAMNHAEKFKPLAPALQLFPNPCTGNFIVNYRLNAAGASAISLYNQAGIKVKSIEQPWLAVGNYSCHFSVADLPAGIYFCTLVTPAGKSTQSIQVLSPAK